MSASYDEIGVNYSDLRQPDPRIETMVWRALGTAETVLNVGAGAGSDEPEDRIVTAVEPSAEMNRQRRRPAAEVVQGVAEDLPFEDNAFDASMAILTIHHWTDQSQGLREMRRVTRGPVVIFTFDPSARGFWLGDYIPEIYTIDDTQMPAMARYEEWLGPVKIAPVPIPHDCRDGFLCAYWRRPRAYFDPRLRKAISSFWKIGDVSAGLNRLASDLDSGVWAKKYAAILEYDAYDFGYRLVTSA
ncbi:MAG: SAM-dependent methyltransferase [Rhodospirillaceae bacterium]|nr:SAM-dependent methyltransferase [Rhodospirillaceae bacterium]